MYRTHYLFGFQNKILYVNPLMKQALRLFFIIVLIKTLDHIIQLLVKIGLI